MKIKVENGKISCGCFNNWKIEGVLHICGKNYTCEKCELRQEGYDLAMRGRKKW